MANIELHMISIPALGRTKRVFVCLPADLGKGVRRPVLFMQDGHNLFDPRDTAYGASWNVHQALDRLSRAGLSAPIVVGVDGGSPHRFDEYSPWVSTNLGTVKALLGDGPHGGEGAAYVDWLADDLKPFIDKTYPTDPDRTWIAGSSMGGLISLYAACRRPETFSKIGAFSPAVWFAETESLACLSTSFPADAGAYVDIGTMETSDPANPAFPTIYLDGARRVRDALRKRGVADLLYVEDEGAIHHESAWERRFPRFLRWLLETKR